VVAWLTPFSCVLLYSSDEFANVRGNLENLVTLCPKVQRYVPYVSHTQNSMSKRILYTFMCVCTSRYVSRSASLQSLAGHVYRLLVQEGRTIYIVKISLFQQHL
jgi:hypothetical protein